MVHRTRMCFDIMQGVSINILIKNRNPIQLAEVFHEDFFGKRDFKYENLNVKTLSSINWNKIKYSKPKYLFIPQDLNVLAQYNNGFPLNEIFVHYNSGIQTKRDDFTIHLTEQELLSTIEYLKNNSPEETQRKFNIAEDGRDWQIKLAKSDILKGFKIIKILYRPFDERYSAYTGNSKGFIAYPRSKTSEHFIDKNNFCLISCRQTKSNAGVFISSAPIDQKVFSAYDINSMFPLYLYPDSTQQSLDGNAHRTPNLNMEIVDKIAEGLGMHFYPEKPEDGRTEEDNMFYPIDILDYIYAVLHSPTYRETYNEFLKIDFPRVPYIKDKKSFWDLVELGGELRQIHLLESPVVEKYITQFPEDGDNIVKKPNYKNGNVHINDTQYFAGVPDVAWNFYIGGYQPAQKWLKDRKDRELSTEDIFHYQKIVVALTETDRIMKEIDKIDVIGPD